MDRLPDPTPPPVPDPGITQRVGGYGEALLVVAFAIAVLMVMFGVVRF